ncbi:MAG: type II toxin-antitoxin system RelE/ParE family toxin [Gemmatimonadaceae bacterium]
MGERSSFAAYVGLLGERGPQFAYPYSSKIVQSRHDHMRERLVQHKGHPYRVLYAFDPRRSVIPLIGADKTGHDRWYDEVVPVADRLYDEHVETLRREGLI